MVIIGIDPGTATTGYGLIRETESGPQAIAYGVIRTPANLPLAQRLKTLYTDLRGLIAQHQPQAGAVEKLFFQKNVSTAMNVGHARGIVLLALAEANLPIGEYSPQDVKQAVAGYGSADKRQVQHMVHLLLNLPAKPHPDDAADALAIALCHLQLARLHQLTKLP